MGILCENELLTNEREERISKFNGIFENINERAVFLKSKCLIQLENLSDSQILEKTKNLKALGFEYSELLNRITELIKAGPADNEKTNEILYKACSEKANLKKLKDEYQKNCKTNCKKRFKCGKNAQFVTVKVRCAKISWLLVFDRFLYF